MPQLHELFSHVFFICWKVLLYCFNRISRIADPWANEHYGGMGHRRRRADLRGSEHHRAKVYKQIGTRHSSRCMRGVRGAKRILKKEKLAVKRG